MRRAALCFAAVLIFGCGSKDKSGGDGGNGTPADTRTFWKHTLGHFEKTADSTWTEVAPDGGHVFAETGRTADAVELTDRQRNIVVTLYADHCTAKMGAFKPNRLYEGAWATRPAGTAPAGNVADWPSDPAFAAKL